MKRLVTEKTVTHGYHGHPKLSIRLECGHYHHFERWTRYEKLQAGKSKIDCYKCKSLQANE